MFKKFYCSKNFSGNPDRISHKFVEVKQHGNNFVTKAKVLDTTCGKQVKNLISGGVKLGMSSRGFGKTNNKNGVVIVENLHLVTLADIVIDPSAPDAWQKSVYENKDWVFENGELVEANVNPIIEKVKKSMRNKPKKQSENMISDLFEQYLKTIRLI